MTREKKTYTPREAASLLACTPSTVYRHCHTGELEAVRLGKRGGFRIPADAIDRFLRPVRDGVETRG